MSNVLFISENYVKDNSLIDENVDVKLLRPTIYDAQRDYILPILGTKLYEKIEADIVANTLAGDYLNLVTKYIAPALVKWVQYEANISLLYKYRNKNVSTKSSENSQPINYNEQRFLMDNFKNKAELRSQDITNYLCANTDLFPEYLQNTAINDIRPKNNNFTTSIYLGDEKNKNKTHYYR